ncbi:MAG: hypothetical protein FJ253_03080 [Phycisphaerae bacterium]|nr:hypothetical protein [Phycisphaerae bacterium]
MAPEAPIFLSPMLRHRAWGGDFLRRIGRLPEPGAAGPFGESWEIADLDDPVPNGRSRVVGGRFDGRTLREAIDADPGRLLGHAARTEGGGFPLVVKYLDARENLSVQVHPGDTSACGASPARARPKNEAWRVIEAAPGAAIFRGIDPAIGRRDFEALLETGRVVEALIRVPVRPGDFVELPGGLCHSLGAGVVVVEVQNASDTTHRLWDWERRDPARPLQRAEALECLRFGAEQRLDSIPVRSALTAPAGAAADFRTASLCRTREFEIEEIASLGDEGGPERTLEVVTDGSPVIWVMLEGSVRFEAPNLGPWRAERWTTVLLPAASQGLLARLDAGSRFLRVTIPDRMGRMLAERR